MGRQDRALDEKEGTDGCFSKGDESTPELHFFLSPSPTPFKKYIEICLLKDSYGDRNITRIPIAIFTFFLSYILSRGTVSFL